MLWWLDDHITAVYIIIAIVGIFAVCCWWVSRHRSLLFTVVVCVGLIALFWGVENLIVTDRERIETIVYEMRDSVLDGDWDGVSKHLTDDFSLHFRGKNFTRKSAESRYADDIKRLTSIHIYNYDTEKISRPDATIFFRVNINQIPVAFRAQFRFENERWKMHSLEEAPILGGKLSR